MFSFNGFILVLLLVGFVLLRVAINGRYGQLWQALTTIPLTRSGAQAQSAPSAASWQRIG